MPVHRVYRAGSPFNASEMLDVDFEQTADVIYFAHENHVPQKLIRHDHTDWEFVDVTLGPTLGVPGTFSGTRFNPNQDAANSGNAYFPLPASYVVTAFNDETGQESRPSLVVTLTNDLSLKRNYNSLSWAAVAGATGYNVYKAENTSSYGLIGRTEQTSFVDKNIGPDLSVGPPIANNPFNGAGNFPSTITFHEQRTFWGRTLNRPNGVWASRSADFENMDFSRPLREDDSIALGLVANKVNSVNQLVSTKQGVLALTSNNLFTLQGANEDYIVATPPPRVRPEISRGASRLNPLVVDNVTFYETAKSNEIRTVGYEFEVDGIKTNDVTIFSRHLHERFNIVEWAWMEKPASAIVAIRDDGRVLCMTWDQAQEVWGWTLWETDGEFKRVCVITEQGEDRAYFLVKRTIEDVDRYYIERMASELWEDQADACYLDCARSFNNDVATTTIGRLEHLEGQTVVALVDAQVIDKGPEALPLVVTNGEIELPIPGLKVTVGLPFTALIETLPLAIQTGGGWSVSRPQQAEAAILRVVDTRNVEAGVNESSLFEIKERVGGDAYNPLGLFTGDMPVSIAGTSGNETVVVIRSATPTPLHVAAVMIEPRVGDAT